jgi:hypothetical protein
MYIEYESKTLLVSGFELTILCRQLSCLTALNHCASSVIVIDPIVIVYVYCCTVRLVTYVWRRTSAPRALAMTSQGLASTCISLKPRSAAKQAQAALEALMWLLYSGQMAREEEPTT